MVRGDLPPVDLSQGEGRPVEREGPALGAWEHTRMGDTPPVAAQLVPPPPLLQNKLAANLLGNLGESLLPTCVIEGPFPIPVSESLLLQVARPALFGP